MHAKLDPDEERSIECEDENQMRPAAAANYPDVWRLAIRAAGAMGVIYAVLTAGAAGPDALADVKRSILFGIQLALLTELVQSIVILLGHIIGSGSMSAWRMRCEVLAVPSAS